MFIHCKMRISQIPSSQQTEDFYTALLPKVRYEQPHYSYDDNMHLKSKLTDLDQCHEYQMHRCQPVQLLHLVLTQPMALKCNSVENKSQNKSTTCRHSCWDKNSADFKPEVCCSKERVRDFLRFSGLTQCLKKKKDGKKPLMI